VVGEDSLNVALIIQIFAPFGLAVLIPLDATGGFLADQNGVSALSMANLSDHSGRLWVHALYAVFCTFLTFYFLYRLYEIVWIILRKPQKRLDLIFPTVHQMARSISKTGGSTQLHRNVQRNTSPVTHAVFSYGNLSKILPWGGC
jgi:hypothetical protein